MDFCLFLEFAPNVDGARLRERLEAPALGRLIEAMPGACEVLVHAPAQARDPFLETQAPPGLALQFYFARLIDLEASASQDGPAIVLAGALAQAGGRLAAWETLVTRRYQVPQPLPQGVPGPWCSYLVAYEGPAVDPHAWMHHYLSQHPPLMRQLPGLRELEICSPLDAVAFLPGRRLRLLQRNKVAFDSPQALDAALHSPVREQMRRDFTTFPAYVGGVSHHAMQTWRVTTQSGQTSHRRRSGSP